MFKTDNSIKVLIGKDVEWDATSLDTMVVGEVTVLGPQDQVIDITTATNLDGKSHFTLIQKSNDGVLHQTARIPIANVTKLSYEAYAAPDEQIDYIGYGPAATTSSIEEIANNLYVLHITYKQDKEIWSEQQNRRIYTYQSGDAPVDVTIAKSITAQINADLFTGVSAEMVMPISTETLIPNGGTLVATNGSTTVTNTNHGITALGTVVRLAGTGATYPVYVITKINSVNSFEIHTPYQGVTIAAGTGRVITAYVYVGIKLTGIALPYVDKGLFKNNKVFWDIALVNCGTTTNYTATVMTKGNGSYGQVRDLEWFGAVSDGAVVTTGFPQSTGRNDADTTKTYNVFTIDYVNTDDVYPISGTKPARALVYVFAEVDNAQNTAYLPQLVALISSCTGKTAI